MDLTELRQRVLRETRTLPDPPTTEDVDDALNLVQRTYLQPIARLRATSTYTTTSEALEIIPVATVAPDIYELRTVKDETGEKFATDVPMLAEDDVDHFGIRRYGDTFYLQRMAPGRKLRCYYFQLLPELGGTVQTPALPATFHDVYWLGAASYLNPANRMLAQTFRDRLDSFRTARMKQQRADRQRVRTVLEWE